jgi:hypothetical protein
MVGTWKSARARASEVGHLVYVRSTGPMSFCHNYPTEQRVNKYRNSPYVPVNKRLWIVQDNHNNRVILMSVREMNNFTEVCKLSHFPLSANRLHRVNMRTHLPRTWGLQIVSLSFVGKPLAPSEHENTLASHLRSANCLTFLCRKPLAPSEHENTLASHFAHLIYRPHIKLQLG